MVKRKKRKSSPKRYIDDIQIYEKKDKETGEKGPNYAVNGFAADAKYVVTRTFTPEQKEAGYSMTVSFKTESGYEATFPTLHIEEAPVTLLAADAMTGATPISFFAPKD